MKRTTAITLALCLVGATAQAVEDDVPAEGGSPGKSRHRPPDPVIGRGARRTSLGGRRTTHLT